MPRPKLSAVAIVDDAPPAPATLIHEAMERIGYDVPYERNRVVQEARFYMGQAAEAALEVGRRLLAIKENEPHGEFVEIVEERLGIPRSTAHRLMQSATKYLLNPKLKDKADQFARLGKAKLFEIMNESDDDLVELAEGGTLAGLTLDEIECKTHRELKAALREAREELAAKDQLLEDKNKKLDAAKAKLKRVATALPDEQLTELMREATSIGNNAIGIVRGEVRQALVALTEHDAERTAPFASGLVSQIMADCRALLNEFGLAEIEPTDETEWITKA
ncbi:TPA: DUF3102 domain-containing protein [Burkholderia stabilis]|nr:DUF3102 domain-containing protein [Burkholderia stabilis]HDR9589138.1 DUF3102 domain-containing protein [Burkholderia stabilis]HDR9649534.1 DUF3102 domain-containing protein [Burkholderia stabilis]HDR9653600.1 DUF3102 domain-containing protein [Burkholderia stabilis]HDR9656295.1 DUF3102 domain-containing protein [Burkholderia stabilis]